MEAAGPEAVRAEALARPITRIHLPFRSRLFSAPEAAIVENHDRFKVVTTFVKISSRGAGLFGERVPMHDGAIRRVVCCATMPSDGSTPPMQAAAGRRRWYIGLAVVVVIAIGLGVWAFTASDSDDGSGDESANNDNPSLTTVAPTSGPPATAPVDVPPVGVDTLPPVGTDEPAAFSGGLEIRVVASERIEAEARPGDIAGPAIAVEIEATNRSDDVIDLIGFTVTATDESGAPLAMNLGDPADPLEGTLNAGESRIGTYVFRVDEGVAVTLRAEDAMSPEAVIVEL